MLRTTFRSSPLPFVLATGALGLLWLSLIAGQLVRLPLPGQGGGLLLSDVATISVLGVAFFFFILQPHRNHRAVISLLSLSPWILWVAAGTLLAASPHSLSEVGVIVAYAIRLITTVLLFPAFLLLMQDKRLEKQALYGLTSVACVLAVIGILQRFFLADLTFLAKWGWDPHQGRLVSTWLDPNFMGVFLAMMIPWLLARKSWALVFIIPALVLTASRSSFIALALSILILSPLILFGFIQQAKKATLVITMSLAGLGLAGLLIAGLLLGNRASSLLAQDPTVQLRLDSLHTAWNVIQDNPWFGVGYNAYQFAVTTDSQNPSFINHSRAGADNSYVTLWATTGLVGLLAFLVPVSAALSFLIRKWLLNHDILALCVALSLVTLLIHANFINSLLYSHLLIVALLMLALTFPRPYVV